MKNWNNQRVQIMNSSASLPLGDDINSLFNIQETVIKKPAGANGLILIADVGDFRIRPGHSKGLVFTADNASDTLTSVAHAFDTKDGPVQLTTSGTLPAGLDLATDYFVGRVDADDFQLFASLTALEQAILVPFTDDGTGNHTIGGMPAVVDPAADILNGKSAVKLLTGEHMILMDISKVTVKSYGVTDVLTYYWF